MNTKASIGLILAFGVFYSLIHTSNTPPDLIEEKGWSQVAGVRIEKTGLIVSPLSRDIVHQDGSASQQNPPVALMAPHLLVDGDFEVVAILENIESSASVRLYEYPPIVYDQWRYESQSVRVMFATSSITVEIWDGSSSNSIDIRRYMYAKTGKTTLVLSHVGKVFSIGVNGVLLGAIPDHGLFQNGDAEVWFGLEASGADWNLSTLVARPIANGRVKVVPAPNLLVVHDDPDALRNLTSNRKRIIAIGSAVSYSPLVADTAYRNIVFGQFSSVTSENGLKPQFVHPEKNTYVFEEMDTLVDATLLNGAIVHGHALVYAKSNPTWITETPKGTRKDVMVSHIKTVMDHFKGRIYEWDVVNEPLSNKRTPYKNGGSGLEQTLWFEAMGEEYIDIAFKTAHEADPSAVLYLNDYGLERDGERWDALLALVLRLKERGVPIDGVGFESHIYGDGDYSDAKALEEHFNILAQIGLLVRISEIDVTGDDEARQIEQYVLALDVCLRASNCTGYTTWGVTDAYGSTTRSDRYPLVYGTSLLWDKEMKAKPVYRALIQRLKI